MPIVNEHRTRDDADKAIRAMEAENARKEREAAMVQKASQEVSESVRLREERNLIDGVALENPANPEDAQQVSSDDIRQSMIDQVASKLPKDVGERYVAEQAQTWSQEIEDEARTELLSGMKDRLADGAFNLEGEKEPSEQMSSSIEELMDGIEAGEIHLDEAQKIERSMLDMVVKENIKILSDQGFENYFAQAKANMDPFSEEYHAHTVAQAEFKAGIISPEQVKPRIQELTGMVRDQHAGG